MYSYDEINQTCALMADDSEQTPIDVGSKFSVLQSVYARSVCTKGNTNQSFVNDPLMKSSIEMLCLVNTNYSFIL